MEKELLVWRPPGPTSAEEENEESFSEHREFRQWHRELTKDRGARALLRRADSLEKLITNAHFFAQLGRWERFEQVAGPDRELALGMTLGLCARVKEDTPGQSFGAQLAGAPAKRGIAPVKEIRFQRLLKTEDPEDLLRQLRRCIALIREHANIVSLADFIAAWFRQQRFPAIGRRNVRYRLAEQYYTNLP